MQIEKGEAHIGAEGVKEVTGAERCERGNRFFTSNGGITVYLYVMSLTISRPLKVINVISLNFKPNKQ